MDNNYQNGLYGNEPSKPFNEKSDIQPTQPEYQKEITEQSEQQEQNDFDIGAEQTEQAPIEKNNTQKFAYEPQPTENNSQPPQPFGYESQQQTTNNSQPAQAFGFEPQKPLMQNQNADNYAQGPQQPNFQNGYAQPQQGAYNQPQQSGYAQPQYQAYQRPVQNNYQQPPQAQQMPNNTNARYGAPFATPYPQQTPPQPPKKSSNKGLIAIILVLCFLLIASVAGIVIFIARDLDNSNSSNRNSNSNGQEHSFTIPDGEYFEQSTTSPTHPESDYSDKTDSSYKGVTLASKPSDAKTNDDYTSETAFNKVSASVVGVVCYSGEVTSVESASTQGSGIILTSDGYVVTNAHVVGNSTDKYAIQIVTSDGKTYTGGVVGVDTRTDIAVLKMADAENLTPATFGDSKEIELGEDILVIGNPGGLDFQNSMTKGIVSAVDRQVSSKNYVKYIQTDAAINPGNSGGPVVNSYGQVIGIATSKIVAQNYDSMCFAIPSATAKESIDSLIKNGYISGRVKIGISGYALSSSGIKGIMVESITEGGPCDNTDLQAGDVITSVDGQDVSSFSEVYEILENHKVGDKIKIKYIRSSSSSGDTGEIEVTLQEDK